MSREAITTTFTGFRCNQPSAKPNHSAATTRFFPARLA